MSEKALRREVEDLRSEVRELKEMVNQLAYALFDEGDDCDEPECNAFPPKQPDDIYGMMYR